MLMTDENILVDSHIREKAQFLMDDSNPFRPGCIGILKINFLSVHIHLACRGLFNSCNHFHQCGFPRTIFPDQHVHLAFQKIKRNTIQGFGTGINLIDLLAVEYNIRIIKHIDPPLFNRK